MFEEPISAAPVKIVPVILAGGAGTRLWPLSRASRPKQFLSLIDDLSLFQLTLRRVSDRKTFEKPIVLTHQDYRFLAAEQAQSIGAKLDMIVLEPAAQNTAPAIAAAAQLLSQRKSNCVMMVLPSDHFIQDEVGFVASMEMGARASLQGDLITFGVQPTRPETGYGYIHTAGTAQTANKVSKFIEKPDFDTAERMIKDGGFFWNSGMFMFTPAAFLSECKTHAADVCYFASRAADLVQTDLDFLRLETTSFCEAPKISVDHAVFEKSERVCMVPLETAWSDLGAWDGVWQTLGAANTDKIATFGQTRVTNSTNSLIYSERDLVVADGLDDIAVVASEDAIYVGKLSQSQRVGSLAQTLSEADCTRALTQDHRTVFRPWGGYSIISNDGASLVKRLCVKPGKRLSLQTHQFRSEHWVVVAGSAEVTLGSDTLTLTRNQSAYVPVGTPHRLRNCGNDMLEIIEVQTGPRLDEKDIVRIEDDYGRASAAQ